MDNMTVIKITEMMIMIMTVMEDVIEEEAHITNTHFTHSTQFTQSTHHTIAIHTITDHTTDHMATNVNKVSTL